MGLYLKTDVFNGGKMLEGIFDYQWALMVKYFNRGMIKHPPADFQVKEDQEYTRKIIGWLTNELGEASDSYSKVMAHYLGDPDQSGLVPMLNDVMNEMADSLHFMVELFIWSGLTASDVLSYYEQLCKERNLELLLTSDGLTTSFNYGNQTNTWDDEVRIAKCLAVNVSVKPGILIAPRLSQDLHIVVELCFWDTVKAFQRAGNLLKKKAWSNSQDGSNIQAYQLQLMEGWLYFMKLANLIGLNGIAMYTYYENMNIKNQERLNNNY